VPGGQAARRDRELVHRDGGRRRRREAQARRDPRRLRGRGPVREGAARGDARGAGRAADADAAQNLGKAIGAGLQKYHEGNGVTFHLEAQVDKLVPSEADPAAVGGVVVGGHTIAADVVVMGVGVSPATEFLKASGLPLEDDGGVVVDELLRVKGQQDVFAIGDIATFPQVMGASRVRRRRGMSMLTSRRRPAPPDRALERRG
jgi:hypothetical protein